MTTQDKIKLATYLIKEDKINNRKKRMHNIASVVFAAATASSSTNRFIKKSYVLDTIRKYIPTNGSDKLGDLRAHGDSCGGHGLNLEMDGSGSESRIFLNNTNINICREFLDKHQTSDADEFRFETA